LQLSDNAMEEPDARHELAQCLRPFIDSLPDHYREAVELSELRGLSQRETADRLGLSLSGAKSRVQRARQRLEELVLACCQVEFDSRGEIMDYRPVVGCAPQSGVGCAEC
jgi:RNA polymerase sigma-70 factor, ECF subfamily